MLAGVENKTTTTTTTTTTAATMGISLKTEQQWKTFPPVEGLEGVQSRLSRA